MNILTFDIEEWFHILETAETEDAEKWDKFETRIYGNTDRILNALEDSGSKATFFIVGWIAKRYPDKTPLWVIKNSLSLEFEYFICEPRPSHSSSL